MSITADNAKADEVVKDVAPVVKDEPVKKDVKLDDIPYARFKEVNDNLKSLQADFDKAKDDQKKLRDAELEEQGKYKDLLEEKKLELVETKLKADEWDTYQADRRKALIERLPEDDRDLYGALPLDKLEEHCSKSGTIKKVKVDNSDAVSTSGYSAPKEVVDAVKDGSITNNEGQKILEQFRKRLHGS